MENIWQILKQFFLNHSQHAWLENHLMYFSIVGIVIIFILLAIIIIKLKKEYKRIR
jgi:hypothetical protein